MAASWPLVLTLAAFLPALAVPPISERYALYGIYNLTNGKAWTNSTNWYTYHSPCEWAGVSCDPNGSHVL